MIAQVTEKMAKKNQAMDLQQTKIFQRLNELRTSFKDLEWNENAVQLFLENLEHELDQIFLLISKLNQGE